MRTIAGWVAALTCSLLGCGDDAGGGGSNDGGAGSGGVEAPVLDEVTPMHGALHLYWTNVTADCDTVEGERKEGEGEYASFFEVPGTVDNEADDLATDPAVVYSYRVRCVRGEEVSEYSNELSASPMAE
jgi:hypothetical protein